MLIIPLTGKMSVRNPPFVTIAIILINCLVWFILQAGDADKQYEASELYFTSGLLNIEISHYLAYRDGRLGKPVEMIGKHKSGAQFPIEIVLTAINAESEITENIQFLGAIRDLTERNRMRSVLVQNEKLASIGLLSAGVAHEINNPLAFIGNNLAVLDRDLVGLMKLLDMFESSQSELGKVNPDAEAKIQELKDEIKTAT